MSFDLIISPEAEAEIDEVGGWYHERNPTIGADFFLAVDNALTAILDNPLQYQLVWKHFRRARLHGFPYNLIYGVSDQLIRVVACVHGRRDPEVWQSRS